MKLSDIQQIVHKSAEGSGRESSANSRLYMPPQLEVLDIALEKGFAISGKALRIKEKYTDTHWDQTGNWGYNYTETGLGSSEYYTKTQVGWDGAPQE